MIFWKIFCGEFQYFPPHFKGKQFPRNFPWRNRPQGVLGKKSVTWSKWSGNKLSASFLTNDGYSVKTNPQAQHANKLVESAALLPPNHLSFKKFSTTSGFQEEGTTVSSDLLVSSSIHPSSVSTSRRFLSLLGSFQSTQWTQWFCLTGRS
jgi:hypothetical protein